jgi:hypothetical protein
MKKTILVMMILAAGYTLRAQATFAYKFYTADYESTDIVPQPIPASFQTAYPVVSMTTTEPTSIWWHSTYKVENNRISYVYYSQQPYYLLQGRDVNYKVALPVINTYIPETVIEAAIGHYGASLYSITTIRAANNEMVYQVCLVENGITSSVWMSPQSTVFTSLDRMRAGEMKDKLDEEK